VSPTGSTLKLIIRANAHVCALPLANVSEVLRPLPVESLAGTPAAVRGLSIVRGAPVPVVDLGALLGSGGGASARYVMLRAGERRIALSVDAVLGISEFSPSVWSEMPPLLRDACPGLVEAVGALDHEAILSLAAGTIVPAAVWDSLAPRET